MLKNCFTLVTMLNSEVYTHVFNSGAVADTWALLRKKAQQTSWTNHCRHSLACWAFFCQVLLILITFVDQSVTYIHTLNSPNTFLFYLLACFSNQSQINFTRGPNSDTRMTVLQRAISELWIWMNDFEMRHNPVPKETAPGAVKWGEGRKKRGKEQEWSHRKERETFLSSLGRHFCVFQLQQLPPRRLL